MKRRRVKITGIGPITPAGVGREEFWAGILEPVSRVRSFNKLDPSLGPFVAAYIDRFDVGEFVERKRIPKGSARHTLFAIAGAALALKDAGISIEQANRRNSVVIAGSSLMDFDGIGKTVEGVITRGPRGAISRSVYTTNAAVIPASVNNVLGLHAKTYAIQTSCCAGMDAIGLAARMISTGEADLAICGGTEAPLFRCPMVELRATGLTPGTIENPRGIDRPFDLWRTTGVVSEGAAMVVLEPADHREDGYALISGYGNAGDIADDVCSGLGVAIRHAMADAGIKVEAVDSINAWGPGHTKIDAAEAAALRVVFGTGASRIPAFSIKGAIGNPLGAAPAIQVVVGALSLYTGVLPPTVNWEYLDPSCPLCLSNQCRYIEQDTQVVNAHGLSGVNASLVMQRC